jgi:hypothetical protein
MKRLLILALATAAPLAGCLHPAPALHATAAEIGPIPDNYSEAVIPEGGTIVLQGDEAIHGDGRHGHRSLINAADDRRGAVTLADSLHRLVRRAKVVDHGVPGDTAAKSAQRWAGQPVGDLLILSFGYADFRAQTPVGDFTAALTKLVRQAQDKGAAVFIVTTPPTTDKTLLGLDLYRQAARAVALKEGVDVIDSTDALVKANVPLPKGDRGSPAIDQAIAGAMVPYIQVVPEQKTKS